LPLKRAITVNTSQKDLAEDLHQIFHRPSASLAKMNFELKDRHGLRETSVSVFLALPIESIMISTASAAIWS
jgi:hypothetical protein